MSKRIFTTDQIKTLLANNNVKRCSEKSITYENAFKMAAVKRYLHEGLLSREIFTEAGFDLDMIGRKTPQHCVTAWTKIYKQKGNEGFKKETRGRGGGGGRPKTKWSTDKKKIEYLEAQVAYLKAKNDFLAKLRAKRTE
jgi:transposase